MGGLLLSLSVIIFALSGIMLNHRAQLDRVEVERDMLPSHYAMHHFNHGSVRGSVPLAPDSILLYGQGGAWLSDSTLRNIRPFNAGLPPFSSGRAIRSVVREPHGSLWCITTQALYRHTPQGWKAVLLPSSPTERLTDLALTPDSTALMLLSRHALYRLPLISSDDNKSADAISHNAAPTHVLEKVTLQDWQRVPLTPPAEYTPRTTLFTTMHHLHSGAIAGLGGRLVVDLVGVILIFLCLSGIMIWCMPKSIRYTLRGRLARRSADGACHGRMRVLRWNLRHHRRLGYYTAVFTLLLTFTGLCLRPPLMLPVVLTKVTRLPWEDTRHADGSENPWYDKLRSIAWDSQAGEWLIHTSEGFVGADSTFARPLKIYPKTTTPPVSPMNLTVFAQQPDGVWRIGSFSGMYLWDRTTGKIIEWFEGKQYDPTRRGRPISSHLIEGIIEYRGVSYPLDHYAGYIDPTADADTTESTSSRVDALPAMPAEMSSTPMSLWNVALELHTGRLFAGDWSDIYLVAAGVLLFLILIGGVKMVRRH